ncbi:MAG: Mrp/NBP35 family ATP-binding protein [Rickettsiales bacterium]
MSPEPLRPPTIDHRLLPHVARIIVVASGKGGVGKSTVTANLAHALTAVGQRVGILDADIYGPSIPRLLGLDTYLKPEIADGLMVPPTAHAIRAMSMALITGDQATVLRAPMITKALVQFLRQVRWGTADAPLDVLLIDMPPGTGDITLSLAQNAPLDGVLLVTTPQQLAVIDAEKCAVAFTKMGVPLLGVIENMSYLALPGGARATPFGSGGGAELAARHHTKLLAQLPLDPDMGRAADAGENYIAKNAVASGAAIFIDIANYFANTA